MTSSTKDYGCTHSFMLPRKLYLAKLNFLISCSWLVIKKISSTAIGLGNSSIEGLPYEYHDEDCHVFDSNGLRFGWRISAHAQSILSAGQKHHNSSPLASACKMVTNKDLKR